MNLAGLINRLSLRRKVFVAPLAVMALLIAMSIASLVLLRDQGQAFREVVNDAFDATTTASQLSLTVAGIHSDMIRHIDLLRREQNVAALRGLQLSLGQRFDRAEAMLQSLEANAYVTDRALLHDAHEFMSIYRIVAMRVTQMGRMNPTLVSSLMVHYNQFDAYVSQLGEAAILAAKEKQRHTQSLVVRAALILVAAALASIALAVLLTLRIGRAVAAPLTQMTTVMSRLAQGEHDLAVPAMERQDEVGSMARAVEVFRHVSKELRRRETDLAQMVERLEAMRDQATAASRAKTEFLANVSHELRTPLNAILGYAQLLLRDRSLGEGQFAKLNTVRQSGEHLLNLINDLLDVVRVEAGKLELFPAAVSLPAFLQGIAEMVRLRTIQKGLRFEYQASDLPSAVQVDEKRLRQVLINLLSNAAKFTEYGGVTWHVMGLGISSGVARLRFEIEDTGVGIEVDKREAIFQQFEQAGDAAHRVGGTGLGLSISRQLVRLMGGDIEVDSAVGQGSVFRFDLELPLATIAAVPAERHAGIVGYQGERRRVLVVDDVPENRALMVDALRLLDFEIIEAGDAEQALALVQAQQPDLVLMDNVMPGMDGLEATRRLRALGPLNATPIVIVSASASRSDEQNTVSVGADAFLSKPVDVDRLVQTVGRLLDLRWVRAGAATDAGSGAVTSTLVAPPREEMEALHRLAQTGSMRDIRERADYLARLDRQYHPFVERLRILSAGFQSQAILNLVERHMK